MSITLFDPEPSADIAVVESGDSYTYSELRSLSDLIFSTIARHAKGFPIIVSLSNSVELAATLLASLRGAFHCGLVPANAPESTILEVIARLSPACILGAENWADKALVRLGFTKSFQIAGAKRTIRGFLRPWNSLKNPSSFHSPCLFKITSGSTGPVRIVRWPFDAIREEARNVANTLKLNRNDRLFVPVSMLHSYGFDLGFLASLNAGAALILPSRFSSKTLEEVSESGATVFLGIPKMYEMFSKHRSNEIDLRRMRWMLSCTGPLPLQIIERFFDRYGIVPTQHYGTSETGALTNHLPAEVLRRPESVGLPMRGVTLSLVGEDGETKGNGPGLVVARSGAVAAAYVSHEMMETSDSGRGRPGFFPGGFETGDLGRFDDEGFLYLIRQRDSSVAKERLLAEAI